MKRFFEAFLVLLFVFVTAQISQAEEYKVLVLPDNIQFDSTNYLVYPDSSIIFASDTINELKKNGRVETVSMTEIRDALRKNTKLSILTKKALKEFKYNYNIPFVDFREIAHGFSTNKVLVITSQTDIQNYFLKRTLWDFLNIPGATVINPAYKLSTYAALIDVDKELVIWENTYYKSIGSMENRIIAQNFAPATEQLEKVKSYSTYFLSPDISRMVQSKILPPVIPGEQDSIVDVSDIKKSVDEVSPIQDELDIKTKNVIPQRTKKSNYGTVVNDL